MLVTGAGTTQYAYDAADRLTSVTPPGESAISYTWDDNGNLTARGSDSFSWDAEDRLVSATVDSETTTFAYNGDGLRDSLTYDSNTTIFTWDVNRSIPQVVDDETYQYVYGLGRIAQVGSSATLYYLTDGLGSTMALTDEAGDLDTTWDYDVFGAVRNLTGSQPNDFTFAGEQVDGSTGLQYLRARYYDAAVGRFIRRDEFAGLLGTVETQNRFAYVVNNPVHYRDPSGMICVSLECAKDVFGGVADTAKNAGVAVLNAPETLAAYAWAEAHGAKCSMDSDIFIVCSEQKGGYGRGGTTVGNVFMTGRKAEEIDSDLLAHEKRHALQWAALGPVEFPIAYYANEVAGWLLPGPSVCWNVFEWHSGFDAGNYGNQCEGFGDPAKGSNKE